MQTFFNNKPLAILAIVAIFSAVIFIVAKRNITLTPNTTAYTKITAQTAHDMLETDADITLIDVRQLSEFSAAHIPNAHNVPLDDLTARAPDLLPDKSQPVMVYCQSGRRSLMAADELVAMGYAHVYDMGGINDWPFEVVSE